MCGLAAQAKLSLLAPALLGLSIKAFYAAAKRAERVQALLDFFATIVKRKYSIDCVAVFTSVEAEQRSSWDCRGCESSSNHHDQDEFSSSSGLSSPAQSRHSYVRPSHPMRKSMKTGSVFSSLAQPDKLVCSLGSCSACDGVLLGHIR